MGIAFSLILLMPFDAYAQNTWQNAPAPIAAMLDSRWFPAVRISPNRRWMAHLERPTFPPIELLAQPRVQIAGIQLNPKTRGPAMEYAFEHMALQDLETGKIHPVELPENAQIRNLHWSPQGNYLAFTLTKTDGIELWVVEAATATAHPLTPPRLNHTYGPPCFWISESKGLLCKFVPFGQPAPPAAPLVPPGPRIEENLGREAPQRTYTNLLQSPHDEALFEYYLSSVLEQVSLKGDRQEIVPNQLIISASLRYEDILWGHDSLAIGFEYWYDSRQLRTWRLHPGAPSIEPILLSERDVQDSYRSPGSPVMAPGPYHRYTLQLTPEGNGVYMKGRGASAEGVYPFLDRWHLDTNETKRLWQSADPYFEQVILLWDNAGTRFMTYRQSPTEVPNYWRHNRTTGRAEPLTDFADPLPWFEAVTRQVVRYRRADGVELSATLYLPPGHEPSRDGPLPTLLWAYPQEYKSRAAAAQVTTAENVFSRPYGYSPLFLLTQGYAVLMNPTMPIIGEASEEPNDTYIQQLTASAQAAVDHLVNEGISYPDQLAIAGHSYGAFTAANLLAHTDLFKAGIANSGAYNRTLTPFGFQGEQRIFWEASQVYMAMSPFTNAKTINEPLLLIHGAEDENAGTYPSQTKRLFGALQGLGGTVRWVELPAEGHSYQSREAIGHTLWEMTRWLDLYVKGDRGAE